MAFYAAGVDQVWSEEARSIRNRTIIDVPRISETDPCAQARVEIRRLRTENANLQKLVVDATAQLSGGRVAVAPTVEANPVVEQAILQPETASFVSESAFDSNIKFNDRHLMLEDVLQALDDITLLIGGTNAAPVIAKCGEKLSSPVTRVNGTGGVFMLIGSPGLHMAAGNVQTTPALVFDPESRVANGGVKQTLADLRALVRNWLALSPNTKVFTSPHGLLQVPCVEHVAGPMILYGKLGIIFKGTQIGTVGQI